MVGRTLKHVFREIWPSGIASLINGKSQKHHAHRVRAKARVDGQFAGGTVGNPSGPYSVGQLVSVANGTSTTSYGNSDALGRAQTSTQTTNGQAYAFGYSYNISELTAETYATGRTINISYDGANRESSVYGTTGTTTTNYVGNVAYAAHGAPTSYQYGQVSNGAGKMVRNNIYNPRLQLAGYSDTNNATGIPFVNATLNWLDGNNNDNGNLQGAGYVNGGTGTPASMTFNEAYLYDAANRLKSVTDSSQSGSSTITNWSRSFGYDVFGNMWVATNSGVTEMGNTPQSNVFTAKNQISGSSYDAAGNQTAVNGNTQTYDAENRQATVSFAGSTESYGYDGDGRRVSKAVSGTGGAATVYVYDAMGRLAAEYSTGAATSPCATCYLSADHLGSTRLVVDQNGNVVARHDFLPFGEEVTVGRNGQWGAGNDTISQKFTAKERDTESGLDYFGARYYGSALGRWASPDPAFESEILELPQTWNRYSYVYNRPLSITDPDGRCPPCVGALIGGVVEGGWNLGTQLYNNGGDLGAVSWREVGANAAGGAVTGALAGATGGGSLLFDAAVGAGANAVGGVVTRGLDDGPDGAFDPGDIAVDAVAGLVGGAGGHVAGELVHVPEEPTLGRSRYRHVNAVKRLRYEKAVAARNNKLMIQVGVTTAVGSLPTHGTNNFLNNYFWRLWGLFQTGPPPAPPKPPTEQVTSHVCTPDNPCSN